MTDTELRLIAALATIGDNSRPNTGYSTPAASATRIRVAARTGMRRAALRSRSGRAARGAVGSVMDVHHGADGGEVPEEGGIGEVHTEAAVAAGADGLMIEVHMNPHEAWSDGSQSLTPDKFAKLMKKLAKVAEAVGREL